MSNNDDNNLPVGSLIPAIRSEMLTAINSIAQKYEAPSFVVTSILSGIVADSKNAEYEAIITNFVNQSLNEIGQNQETTSTD